MTQINRFDAFAHISSMKLEPDGDYVLYSDHVAAIAVVRQQAAQGRKVELGKVRELIFMVRNLTPYLAQLGYADLSRSFNDYADEALAELDAFEKEG